VKIILEKFEEKFDAETFSLFEDAIEKLGKIDVQAHESKKQIDIHANVSKKQIIINLAKSLEEKIPIDTICMEITNRLGGIVSASFIRQCLDEKYKQKVRSENAKKQKPRSQELKLATLPTLNQQEELKEETEQDTVWKGDTIVDAGDKISIEEEEKKDRPSTTADFSVMAGKTIVPVSYQQEHQLKEKTNHGLKECSSDKEPVDENHEDALGKSSQVTIAGKMVTFEEHANTHDDERDKSILPFEFPIYFKKLQKHMDLLFRKSGSDGRVWFNGKIDIKTREVISPNIGRIGQQQQNES
jgi:hypothetical protein